MSWTLEQFNAYKQMLDEESKIQRLLREAREGEDAAEWYFDRDSETKAAHWYYGANQRYVMAAAYTLGLLFGFTFEEVDEQWAKAEEEWQKSQDES